MRTVYGVRIEASAWTVDDHRRARDLVDQWVEAHHPFADRGPGVSVRVDDEDPQRWWRYSIGESLAGGDISSTVVSASTGSPATVLEIRLSVVPGGTRIRLRSSTVSAVAVRELARSIVAAFMFLDAGVRITDRSRTIIDEVGAQEIAAFCDAPSRSLPIVIESVPSRGVAVFRSERLGLTLCGLAHIVVIEGDEARHAFNSFFGEDLLLPQGLALVWPDHSRQTWNGAGLAPTGGDEVRKQCIRLVTEAAAESLGSLRPPLFRRRSPEIPSASTYGTTTEPASDDAQTTGDDDGIPSTVSWHEYRAALDGWQESEERITELEEALTEADRVIAEKQLVLERGDELRDQLVLQNTELAIRLGASPRGLTASSAIDAVRQASQLCENLTFHPRALESAQRLDGIDATRLLQDFVRLNVVAGDWQSGRINNATLTISCRSLGLNYAGGISDTAEYKYGDDYAFSWRGRTEYAVAHIRNGKGNRLYRVHLFFDNETQQVVVAYIGRHLRGKHSS
jgi:hypothetical protein